MDRPENQKRKRDTKPYLTIMMPKALFFVLLTVVFGSGCREKTAAQLERFMDTPDTAPVENENGLDPSLISKDTSAADAIHMASFSRVANLLGAHRYHSKIHFRFEGPRHQVSLREDSSILLARNGDFRVEVENDKGQGYGIVFSNGQFYVRDRYGPYHLRSRLAEDHLKWREQAYSGWAAVYKLFRGRLNTSKLGSTNHYGRNAYRYSIGLTPGNPRLPGTLEPPQLPEGITKYIYPIEPTKSYQDKWRDKAKPWQVKGSLVLDAQTGVILAAELTGQWQFNTSLPQNEPDPDAPEIPVSMDTPQWISQTVTLHVWAKILKDGFGNPPSIPTPSNTEVQPVPERIQTETKPLDILFGKGYTAKLAASKKASDRPETKSENEK